MVWAGIRREGVGVVGGMGGEVRQGGGIGMMRSGRRGGGGGVRSDGQDDEIRDTIYDIIKEFWVLYGFGKGGF